MKYNIAVFENNLTAPLFAKADREELIITDETGVASKLADGSADIALMDPISYLRAFKKTDLRILPATVVAAAGYTELINLSFKQNLKTFSKLSTSFVSEYLIRISMITLSERYSMECEINTTTNDDTDAVLTMYGEPIGDNSLDITEDWFDSFEFPLPIAFWAVRADFDATDAIDLVKSIADDDLIPIEPINELTDSTTYSARGGEIFWQWDDRLESALDEVFEMLYYYGYSSEIYEAKIFGRDTNSLVENEN